MAKYVIIGNSTAAIGCVEGIRSKDKDGEIVLIASENHHTYARRRRLCARMAASRMWRTANA